MLCSVFWSVKVGHLTKINMDFVLARLLWPAAWGQTGSSGGTLEIHYFKMSSMCLIARKSTVCLWPIYMFSIHELYLGLGCVHKHSDKVWGSSGRSRAAEEHVDQTPAHRPDSPSYSDEWGVNKLTGITCCACNNQPRCQTVFMNRS